MDWVLAQIRTKHLPNTSLETSPLGIFIWKEKNLSGNKNVNKTSRDLPEWRNLEGSRQIFVQQLHEAMLRVGEQPPD
jgi:hypothetical protein